MGLSTLMKRKQDVIQFCNIDQGQTRDKTVFARDTIT